MVRHRNREISCDKMDRQTTTSHRHRAAAADCVQCSSAQNVDII